MRCLIYQYNKNGDIYDVSILNKKYANIHNYEYKFMTNGFKNVTEKWQPIFIAREYIKFYDVIFYINPSSIIHNTKYDIINYLNNKSMMFQTDIFGNIIDNVFVFKNDENGRHAINVWCNSYDSDSEFNVNVNDVLDAYRDQINILPSCNSIIFNNDPFIVNICTFDHNILTSLLVYYISGKSSFSSFYDTLYSSLNKKSRIQLYNKIYNILSDKNNLMSSAAYSYNSL